ncbi:MAG: deoxyribodipyrimidine photo-lyase [Ferruginibacter sp.]
MSHPIQIFWFRRDLRLYDNAGLYKALTSGNPVLAIFIFDKNILHKLEDKADKRVQFIHNSLHNIQSQLVEMGASLLVHYGTPEEAFELLTKKYNIAQVFTNRDYEPYAQKRDESIAAILKEKSIGFQSFKDQVIFDQSEVVKDDGKPYTVFTPYSRKWKAKLNDLYLQSYPTEKHFDAFLKTTPFQIPELSSMGFEHSIENFPPKTIKAGLIQQYAENRNFPGITGTSKLGLHFRFGTISIRKAAAAANNISEIYLNELIWRDFYHMILWQFPQIGQGKAFKPAYDSIEWRKDEGEFKKWCEGQTGYPIVDAGMRELNTTGFMHNRVRMIVASFLCKHLLLDWRLGEAYFAAKLLDFDLAANNGGWQWAAGSGCDAAPYFRIFNPYLQTKKFDPELTYIRKWVPEFESLTYPQPIVVHEVARKRCLEVYGKALAKSS